MLQSGVDASFGDWKEAPLSLQRYGLWERWPIYFRTSLDLMYLMKLELAGHNLSNDIRYLT